MSTEMTVGISSEDEQSLHANQPEQQVEKIPPEEENVENPPSPRDDKRHANQPEKQVEILPREEDNVENPPSPRDGKPRHLNTWDMPELMKGAKAGATNVERSAFEDRCKAVWKSDQKHEKKEARESNRQEMNDVQLAQEKEIENLREMFPMLDPGLIRSLYLERGSEGCIEDLVKLSAAMDPEDAKLPELKTIDIESASEFPSLSESTRGNAVQKKDIGDVDMSCWVKL